MFTEHLYDAAGPRLNVARGPANGPPLWLLHGLGRGWRDFAPLVGGLLPFWQIWANDHRGHGGSDRVTDEYLVPNYIRDAADTIGLAHGPVVLVGHSLGALVALGLAAGSPDHVRAVVLLDPPGPGFLANIAGTASAATWTAMRELAGSDRPPTELARELAAVTLPGGGKLGDVRDAAALRFLARCLRDLDGDTLLPPLEARWLCDFDPLVTAAAVQCPALLVVSDPDYGGMTVGTDAADLTAALPDVSRVDLPGVGHLPHWQDPAACGRVLHSFLASL